MVCRILKALLTIPAVSMAMLGFSGLAAAAKDAEAWPSRPIQMVVPFAPGGSNDVIARQLAQRLTQTLGQSVVILNRAGGGSSVGAQGVATSPADGYTFLFVSSSLATTAAVQKTPYNPVTAFDAVSRVATAPFVIITRKGFPAKNVSELVAYAKANPGKINYGTAGMGDSTELAMELLSTIAGIQMTAIRYKGIAPAQLDLVAGRLDVVITTMASTKGTVSDELPKIAFTGTTRDPEFPDIPTVRESGIDYVVDIWWGVFAPSSTPATIIDRMNKEIATIVPDPQFGTFLKAYGAQPAVSTPQALQDLLARDVVRWTETAKRAGISQR